MMKSLSRLSLTRKIRNLLIGLSNAWILNFMMLGDMVTGRKAVTLHVNSATMLFHIRSVIDELLDRNEASRLAIYVLTDSSEVDRVRSRLSGVIVGSRVRSDLASRFLLFCRFLLSVNQGMIYPWVGCKVRACSFHGQPSKGNVFEYFNHSQINHLFFYGPLMRDNYLAHKQQNKSWRDIQYYEVGQPASDQYFQSKMEKSEALDGLGLNPEIPTIVYAPSFEYCSSLASHGVDIIERLLDTGVNVIVKPHPAFYESKTFDDGFNNNAPNIAEWSARVSRFSSNSRCVFSASDTLDMNVALLSADLMLTDFSGVAFDGILRDLGMIYWDCPEFFDTYLPGRFGVDGQRSRDELSSNVGRECGEIVSNLDELVRAVSAYIENPEHRSHDRGEIRAQLLFNQGHATSAMTDIVEQLAGLSR